MLDTEYIDMPKMANRIISTPEKSFGMYQKALGAPDPDGELIHLELGRPLYDTPQHIKDAAIAALQEGKVHYSDLLGEPALRTALARKLREFNNIEVKPHQVLVANGLTQASYIAFMTFINPGDEVIFLDPFYPQHVGKVELAGGKVVTAPLDAENNYSIRPDWIEQKVTDRTRMIVLVNPSNPTGRVYSREELSGLAEIAIRHDLLVVSDEVYEYITFDGNRHVSIASLPGMQERTISMFAFTKAYAMDGWRLGYLTADERYMQGFVKISSNEVTHVNTFIQYGALAAVEGPHSAVEEMVAGDLRKRDMVVSKLNQMPGVICPAPEGTIYAFPDISGTGLSSQALADALLSEARIVVEAGSFYGEAGEGRIRVCFGSQPYERLETAMDRMSGFLNTL